MDLLQAFNIAMTLVAFLGGWLIKGLFDRLKELENANRELSDRMSGVREALPTHYVRREDFRVFSDDIFAMLRRIEDKIDGKADKH